MGCLTKLGLYLVVISIGLAYFYNKITEIPEKPNLKSEYWGPGSPKKDDVTIRPFQINIPQKQIDDLKTRLKMTRMQKPLEGVAFNYGVNSEYFKEVIDFWLNKYDWRAREKHLNRFPQYITQVNGLNIHYIHVKPAAGIKKRVLPLMILHGWPGSVREFYDIIPILTAPQKDYDFVFEVIAPSLPGYGFSEGAAKPGLGAAQIAVVLKDFINRLGFDKIYMQGGDWGSIISMNMATLYPEKIIGLHSNFCYTNTIISNLKLFIGQYWPSLFNISDAEYKRIYPLKEKYMTLISETGYFHLQATKPDTLGISLQDSPAGLAAYILEKFSTGTDIKFRNLTNGGLLNKYKMEDLLDNVMYYWWPGSITTAIRLYSETFQISQFELNLDRIPIQVPTACAFFPHDLPLAGSFSVTNKMPQLMESKEMPRGGHFAAFEEPQLLADHIFLSIKKFNQNL